MKAFPLHPVALAAAALLWAQTLAISAQEATQAAAEHASPFRKSSEQLNQINDDFAKQVDVFVAVVDAERNAKRISDTVAQLLRILAQNGRSSFAELDRNVPKNEAIRAALKELEAASKLYDLRVNPVLTGMWEELRKRMNDSALGAPKVEDIAPLGQTLQRIQGSTPQKILTIGNNQISAQDFMAFLNDVKQLAEDENNQSLTAFATVATNLRRSATSINILTPDEIREFLSRLLEPKRKAVENQGIAIEAMIAARKPAQEISAAVEPFAEGMRKFNELSGETNRARGAVFSEDVANFYRTIATVLNSLEKGETLEADRYLKDAAKMERQLTLSLRGNRGGVVENPGNRELIAAKLQKELWERADKLREQTATDIIARMTSVKEPADIAALIEAINKVSRQVRLADNSGRYPDISELAGPLVDLMRAWKNEAPHMIGAWGRAHGELSATFAKDFNALRDRIQRNLYASTLKAPELTTPPYADKVPEAAVEALCDDLAQRGEWRRLLDILQLRPAAQAPGSKEIDATAALRSYLAGKNSEMAEQWVDAVMAYKTTLRSTASRAPVQAAADSIKAIAKAHPEAIIEATKRENSNATPTKNSPPQSTASPGIPTVP